MKRQTHLLLKDFRLFLRIWYHFIFRRTYRAFSRFEKAKGFLAQGLYRQRGRFARPFVHAGMGGVVAMAVTLAPVLANSFPGIEGNLAAEETPSTQVLSVEGNETTTEVSDKVRDKVYEHTVQQGETISTIAEKFGVSVDTIKWENNLSSTNAIKPGQKLRILPVPGIRHKVARGETIYTIAKKYEANPQAIVDFPFNTFSDNETFALAVGQELIVPDGKKPREVPSAPSTTSSQYLAKRTPDAGIVSATGSFAWPLGGVITQRFSWYHRAIDIAAPHGTPIVAADSGKVIVAGWPDNSGYGLRVVLDHENGYTTLYGHMSKLSVVQGQRVKRGDLLGLEGSTGRSTGPHLHFEIRKGGALLSPFDFLK